MLTGRDDPSLELDLIVYIEVLLLLTHLDLIVYIVHIELIVYTEVLLLLTHLFFMWQALTSSLKRHYMLCHLFYN